MKPLMFSATTMRTRFFAHFTSGRAHRQGMAGRACPSRQLKPCIGFGWVILNREIQTYSQDPQCQMQGVMLMKEGPEGLAKFRLT